jgi:hypothetical protein
MGMVWALAWGVIGGGIMEGIVDPHGRLLDMWPQTLALPGFISGVAFSLLLWLAEGRRRFDELSHGRFAAYGAVVGLTLGGLALLAGFAPRLDLWARVALALGPLTLVTTASAAGTLAMARLAARRERYRLAG